MHKVEGVTLSQCLRNQNNLQSTAYFSSYANAVTAKVHEAAKKQQLEIGFSHGDLWNDNIIVEPVRCEFITLIDWDDARSLTEEEKRSYCPTSTDEAEGKEPGGEFSAYC